MNIKLYNAAITQLRGKAMESLAVIDILLNNPTMVPDHSSLVKEIVTHSRVLAEYEGAMITLQQYFAPEQPEQHPQAAPAQPKRGPIREEEIVKTSATFRNSQKNRADRKKDPETT